MRYAPLLKVLVVMALLCSWKVAQAEELSGKVMYQSGEPVSGGGLVIQEPGLEGEVLEADVAGDGSFTIGPVAVGKTYRVEYYPAHSSEKMILEEYTPAPADFDATRNMLQFQIVGAVTLRMVLLPIGDDVKKIMVQSCSPFAFTLGATKIQGGTFNGSDEGFDTGIGWSGSVTYLISSGGSSAANAWQGRQFFWLMGFCFGQNRYTVPLRMSEGTGDAAYNREQVLFGPYWLSSQGRAEYGLGASLALGGVYDGSQKLELKDSGTFSITSYGLFGSVGRQVGASPLRLAARVDLLSNSGSQEPEYWQGTTAVFTLGLTYRPVHSEWIKAE